MQAAGEYVFIHKTWRWDVYIPHYREEEEYIKLNVSREIYIL